MLKRQSDLRGQDAVLQWLRGRYCEKVMRPASDELEGEKVRRETKLVIGDLEM